MAQAVGRSTDLLTMEYVTRFIGIALLVWLVVLSVGNFRDRLETIEETGAAKALVQPEDRPVISRDAEPEVSSGQDGEPPEYLAFSEPLRPGLYAIADLSGSDDDDDERGDDDDDERGDEIAAAPLKQLTPGMYATEFGTSDCSYELRSVMKDDEEAIIGKDSLSYGRMLVSINEIEPDTFSSTLSCGGWIPWSPLEEALTVVGNGDYWIGDLKTGVWQVPEGCMWEKVVGFRGAKLWDVQSSGHGPQRLIVDDSTLGVRIRGCGSSFRHQSVSTTGPGLGEPTSDDDRSIDDYDQPTG